VGPTSTVFEFRYARERYQLPGLHSDGCECPCSVDVILRYPELMEICVCPQTNANGVTLLDVLFGESVLFEGYQSSRIFLVHSE
jgi:hypothetical protein